MVLDLYAATMRLRSELEVPRGSAVSNAPAEHFEDAVQRIVDQSQWAPPPAIRQLRRRTLVVGGRKLTDIDAIGANGESLLLVSCKSTARSEAYLHGDYKALRNARTDMVQKVQAWQRIIAEFEAHSVGDNYDLAASRYPKRIGVVCMPLPLVLLAGPATAEAAPGLLWAATLTELEEWLQGRSGNGTLV